MIMLDNIIIHKIIHKIMHNASIDNPIEKSVDVMPALYTKILQNITTVMPRCIDLKHLF